MLSEYDSRATSDGGIYVKSMFMFGNPEDSVETIKKTINN